MAKRILSALLIVILAIILVGCSKEDVTANMKLQDIEAAQYGELDGFYQKGDYVLVSINVANYGEENKKYERQDFKIEADEKTYNCYGFVKKKTSMTVNNPTTGSYETVGFTTTQDAYTLVKDEAKTLQLFFNQKVWDTSTIKVYYKGKLLQATED